MKTIILRSILVAALIGAFSFYSYTSNPKYFLQFISNKSSSDTACPSDIKDILQRSGLTVAINPICTQPAKIKYGTTHAKLINVAYGWAKSSDAVGTLEVPVLVVPKYILFKETVLLPREYRNDHWLMSYLEKELKTPFGNWTNFTTENFAEENLKRINASYCIEYKFKYPFTGILEKCPKNDQSKPYDIFGSVKYINHAMQWEQARNMIFKECPKFGLQCINSESEWAKESPLLYWSGPHANSGLFIAKNIDLKKSYYAFVEGTYDNGTEGMILVKVFLDGTVTSSIIERKSYQANELLKL